VAQTETVAVSIHRKAKTNYSTPQYEWGYKWRGDIFEKMKKARRNRRRDGLPRWMLGASFGHDFNHFSQCVCSPLGDFIHDGRLLKAVSANMADRKIVDTLDESRTT
jgi:hypothetical protein